MAFICTLRGPARSRPSMFVPGSLACAAVRPFAVSTTTRRAASPLPVLHAEQLQSSPQGDRAPLTDDHA